VAYALDPVGGDTGTAVFRSLGAEGRLLLYGTLSGEPVRIDSRLMIAGKRVVEGFWLGHWMPQQSIPAALVLFRQVARLIREGALATELGATFPLEAVVDAVREAESVGRRGKVLLRIGS
jgi:NADPH:quinone reductase-like Zn-dependent oxidoreductase